MVALARTLGGAASAEMVRLARVYVQQPRSTVRLALRDRVLRVR